jgi:ferredoxin-NADP reductase/DMSO/TMAO reductase YedYZ heme-binding membrane subunit
LQTLFRETKNMTNLRFARSMLWINGVVPAAILGWDAYHHELGPDPTNSAIHTTGLIALIFLALSLLVTPVRKLTRWNDAIVFRRVLGLYAFYYACGHLGIFYYQQGGHFLHVRLDQLRHVWDVIWNTRYQLIGLIALAAMLPLALTSSNSMVRLLGPTKWSALHRLAYAAAIAASVHFVMQGKFATPLSKVFAWIFAGLLLFRYGAMFFVRGPKKPAGKTGGFPVVTGKARFWKGRLKVARVFNETPDVRTFRLTAPDGKPIPFDYQPGQYLNLALMIDGKRVNRSYTIASSPSRNGSVEVTVKREEKGVSSRHLHDRVHEGDELDVSAPSGKFWFAGMDEPAIVLIGGGVGITPLMSVVRYLTDHAWPGDIYLIYSVRSEADIIFKDELNTLARRFPNLHLTITLSRADGTAWKGPRGRITPELLKEAVPKLSTRLVHLCGPDTMMDPVREMLRGLGVPDDRIKVEKFESPKPMPETGGAAEPVETPASESSVTFTRSGKMVPADGRVILELAEDAGLEIPFDCRSGICGTCKVQLTAGRVQMETRDALSKGEEMAGTILACQARPVGDVSLDV